MELKGKKIVFVGDSITCGVGTTSEEKIFWNLLCKRNGATAYADGISGTRIANYLGNETDAPNDYFATRIEKWPADADIIVVFGGTNDFGHGDAPFGTHEDRTPDTYCGALHDLMSKLITRYPDAAIVFMTPLHRTNEDELVNDWIGKRHGPLVRYVDAIIETAAFYSIPVLDLYRVSGMQPRVPVIQEKFIPDGLHPNDAGHERLANRLESVLRAL